MPLPSPRGVVSHHLGRALTGAGSWDRTAAAARTAVTAGSVIHDEDLQIGLLMLYELHYRGLDGVDDDLEWAPEALAVRRLIEEPFERQLRELAAPVLAQVPTDRPVADQLFAMTAPTSGPGLSKYLAREATAEQYREFLTHRSIYHLKEADPHTWAIPRLPRGPKAALVEVQCDEYGGGREDRMHASLFARTMRALDLDDGYGALVDRVPAVVLATVNAMSMFGLHRRLLGAIVGHLAAFEMTSSLPNKLYGNGLRRLGFGPNATLFFDEHVEADAVHEQVAGRDLAGGLVAVDPDRAPEVLFGAATCLALDDLVAEWLLASWSAGDSSLRPV